MKIKIAFWLAVAVAAGSVNAAITRVGAVNWDCSVPSWTFFGKASTNVLGPEKYRDRTPYFAKEIDDDKIEYSYRTLAEYERELQYAIDAGIDYFAYCWYDQAPQPAIRKGRGAAADGHLQEITKARLNHAKSVLRDKIHLCAILVTTHAYSDEELTALALEMREPWYEKAMGRPLVYMFPGSATLSPRLKDLCKKLSVAEPYVVAMVCEPPSEDPMAYANADAISAYACTEPGPDPAAYCDMAVLWNGIRATSKLPVVPHFSTGWNPTPRMEIPTPWTYYPNKPWAPKLSEENWLDQARKLRAWTERNERICPTGHVMAFAWNEFEEGGWICPNLGKDGKPDVSRVNSFRKVVETLKAAAPAGKILQRHDYFTDEALAEADMEGVDLEIAAVLAQADRKFTEAEETAKRYGGHERLAIERRLEIAKRLRHYIVKRAAREERDDQLLAWQGAQDLRNLYQYFNRETLRADEREALPEGHVFNVRDFGAKGDGRSDDGPAFRKAISEVAKHKGVPVVLKVPAGNYRISHDLRSPMKDFKMRDFQTGDNRGLAQFWNWSSVSIHLFLHNLDHLTIRGEGEKTVISFMNSSMGGFGIYGCREVFIENLVVDYPDNPSTQGVVDAVESEPFAVIFHRQDGYPDPDIPRFSKALSRYFSPVGLDGHYLPTGVGRMGSVENLGDGRFRLKPLPQHLQNPVWRSLKAGDKICIVARYAENAGGSPVKCQWSAFCGLKNIRFLDSPGQVVWFSGGYALSIVGCRATGRDGSDDYVTSNADAILGGGLIGPYVSDCVFSGLEDDGINISANTGEVTGMPKSRRLSQCRTNGSQPASGGFISDGVDGRIKMFMRYGKNDVSTRPLPETIVTADDLKNSADAKKAWFDRFSQQKKGVVRSDKNIRIPNTSGAVLRNTEFSWLRGRGIQVHCGNMIIENVKVHDVTGVGISIHALLPWAMCYDIYNILLRNCSFERVGGGTAVRTRPDSLISGELIKHRMHFGIELDNCLIAPGNGKPAVVVDNTDDICFKNCSFGKDSAAKPIEVHSATDVRIE